MYKIKVKGSYTIEAALIFPFIFFIIIALIYLGFYIHDIVKIKGTLNATLLKGRDLVQHEADIIDGSINYEEYYNRDILYPYFSDYTKKEKMINSYLAEEFKTGFFITKLNSIKVIIDTSNIDIELTTIMVFPFYQIQQFFIKSSRSVIHSGNIQTQPTVEFIRIFDTFSGVAEKTEVINGVLNKIRDVLN